MNKKIIAVMALMVLAAVVMALDVDKAEQTVKGTYTGVKKMVLLGTTYVALAVMLADIVFTLLIRRRGLPELFSSFWFWVPFLFVTVPVLLGLVSTFSPEVKSIYDKMVDEGCPFLYCPQ